jgi:hypothetical protein
MKPANYLWITKCSSQELLTVGPAAEARLSVASLAALRRISTAHKKSRPGQGRLRIGLVKNSSGCGSEEFFTSGEEWALKKCPEHRLFRKRRSRRLTYINGSAIAGKFFPSKLTTCKSCGHHGLCDMRPCMVIFRNLRPTTYWPKCRTNGDIL